MDDTVNRLLDVDPQREVAFSLVPLGHAIPRSRHNLQPQSPARTRNRSALPPRNRLSAHARNARCIFAAFAGGSCSVARRHSANTFPASYADRSSSFNLYRTRKFPATQSSKSSCAAVPAANLPARRSLWLNCPPCSTAPRAACPPISSIPSGSQLNHLYLIVQCRGGSRTRRSSRFQNTGATLL